MIELTLSIIESILTNPEHSQLNEPRQQKTAKNILYIHYYPI